MITERDITIKQEQHRDRLNRAERQRRLEQLKRDKTKTTLWQQVGNLIASHDKKARTTRSKSDELQTRPGSLPG